MRYRSDIAAAAADGARVERDASPRSLSSRAHPWGHPSPPPTFEPSRGRSYAWHTAPRQFAAREATAGPTTRIASVIARYARPEMTRVWSDEAKLETWLAVELAVARCLGARSGRSREPRACGPRARARRRRPERVAELERTTNHDVAAFVDAVSSELGPDGRWFHYGLTSSDVLDTALALTVQARRRARSATGSTAHSRRSSRAREEHRDTITIGRTHGVHAEPTTFGLKLLGWAFQLERDRGRLDAALAGMRVGKLSGAVGDVRDHDAATSSASRARRSGLEPGARARRRSSSATATPSC